MDRGLRFAGTVLSAWLLLASAGAQAAALNDTAQFACYDDTATSTGAVSSGTPDPETAGFDRQDCTGGAAAVDAIGAQVKIGGSSVKGRDYSKIGNNGSVLANSAIRGLGPTDWGCTRDNVTGLTWGLSLSNGLRYSWGGTANSEGDTCAGNFASCDTDSYIALINSANLCGYNDWRLPTPQELESLLAYDDDAGTNTWLDRTWFPDETSDGVNVFQFWTNTLSPDDGTSPWTVSFEYLQTTSYSPDSAAYVRLVHAPSPSTTPGPFTTTQPVPAEYVTTDARTGLMWKTCAEGLSGSDCMTGTQSFPTWSVALTSAASSTYAGYDDWRLPTATELSSLRNYEVNPGLDATAFPNAGITAYWSSTNTPISSSLGTAVTYSYQAYSSQGETLKTSSAAVRLVRAGNHLAASHSNGDFTPDAFILNDVSAPADELATSNTITVSGLASATDIASLIVTGAPGSAYAINGGPFTALAGAVKNGDTVAVRHVAAASTGQTATTTLNIGGVSEDFVTTALPPTAVSNVIISASPRNQNQTTTITASFTPTKALAAGDAITVKLTGFTFSAGAITITAGSGFSSQSSGSLTGNVDGGETDAVIATLAAGVSANAGVPVTLSFPAINPSGGTLAASGLTVATSRDMAPVASSSGISILGPRMLVFTAYPTAVAVNAAFTVRAEIRESDGSSTTATNTVTVTKKSGPGTLTCAPSQVAAVAGLATFNNCKLDTAGDHVITASATGILSADTPSFAAQANPPGAPTIGAVTRLGGGSLSVAFTAPVDNGGSPITSYTATSVQDGITSNGCTASPCTVGGLDLGTPYTFRVKATNAAGLTGPDSAASSPGITPGMPPNIDFVNERTSIPMNHRSNFVNFFVADQVLEIGDPDGDVADLTVTATVSDSMLFPDLFGIPQPILTRKYQDNVSRVGSSIQPAKNNSGGPVTITYTVTDADGLTSTTTSDVTVTSGNVRPTATYSHAIRLPVGSPAGTYIVNGLVFSQSPGDGEESSQQVLHNANQLGAMPLPINPIQFEGPGLSFELLGHAAANGEGEFAIWPIDNFGGIFPSLSDCRTGFEWGRGIYTEGSPSCGAEINPVRVVIGDVAGLGISVVRDALPANRALIPSEARDGPKQAQETTPITYRIRVVNNGSVALQGVRITATRPAALQNATWTCTAPGPGCVAASGSGAVSTLVDLDLDDEAIVLFSGDISSDLKYLIVQANAQLPAGVPAAQEPVVGAPLLLDVVSDAFISIGNFESY